MKKILSLIMALTLIITSLAFAGTTVYADTDVYKDYGIGSDFNETLSEHQGRSNVLYFRRNGDKNTFFDFNVDMKVLNTSNYQVFEVSVLFGENIEEITINAGKTEAYSFSDLPDGAVLEGCWNDLKFVLKSEVGTYGRAYLNEKFIGDFEVSKVFSNSDKKVRIQFKESKNDATKVEEIWVDLNSVKVTEKTLEITPDGHAFFNPDEASPNGVLIVGAYNNDGTVAKVDTKSVTGTDTLVSGFTGAYNYKAFLFNSLTDIKPLVNSVSVK